MSLGPTFPTGLPGIHELRRYWVWYLLLGILLVLLGFFALGYTVLVGALAIIVLGIFLLVSGAFQVIQSFSTRGWGGFFLHLAAGLVDIFLGCLFVARPLLSEAVLTLFLAAFFLAGGAFRIGVSLSLRFPNWGWVFFSGLVTLILGILLIVGWPETSLWFIGFCIALDMIFHGWAWIFFAFSLRSVAPPPANPTPA